MPRPKTQSERAQIITRIIELVKEHGRITTNDVVAMFDLHRTTAEKYIRTAVQRGELLRYGRCGIFRDQRAVIDFDLKRFSHNKK
jgi:DeoR/GlpR family transcriptional regulator of sugar metabolism